MYIFIFFNISVKHLDNKSYAFTNKSCFLPGNIVYPPMSIRRYKVQTTMYSVIFDISSVNRHLIFKVLLTLLVDVTFYCLPAKKYIHIVEFSFHF